MSEICQYIRQDAGNIRCESCGHTRRWNRADTLPKRTCQGILSGAPNREYVVCQYRGEQIREERCKLCGGRERMEPVYKCAKHGECTARKYRADGQGIASCVTCRDFLPPDDAATLRKPATVLLSFAHGLGDAVQFMGVLRHLRTHRPELTIDVASYADRRGLFETLCREFHVLGKEPDEAYDLRYSVPWGEPVDLFPDSPGTKAERCLRESPFLMEPDPDLSAYRVSAGQDARDRAARFASELGKRFALVHNTGYTGGIQFVEKGKPDGKNMPGHVLEASVERLRAFGLLPVILDWSATPHVPRGCVHLGKGHWLWAQSCLGDPQTLFALSQKAAFCLGVDSGPGHLFGAVDADYWRPGTPTVIAWVENHPVNYYCPAPHVLHVLETGRPKIRGEWAHGRDYFRVNYPHIETTRLARGVPDAIDRMLDRPSYGLPRAADVTLRHWVTDLCQPNPAHAHHPGQPHDRPASFDLLFRLAAERFDGPTIVETGCIRALDDWQGAGNFTILAAWFAKHTGGKLHSVDNDPGHVAFARARCKPFGDTVTVHESDSVAWLREGRERIDVLYLDSMDTYVAGHEAHCLAELQAAQHRLHAKSIVCIDDTPWDKQGVRFGKGTLALPWLAANGWRVIHDGYQIVAVKQ